MDTIGGQRVGKRPQGVPRSSIPMHQRKAFFSGIIEGLSQYLPAELKDFRHRGGDFSLIKIWYDHYRVHYEVALDQQIGKIEIGLHFEDGPASSLQYLALFDAQILEIKDRLGVDVELERWTQSWARIYELRPLTTLDDNMLRTCIERLARFIIEFQPIVAGANIQLERPGE